MARRLTSRRHGALVCCVTALGTSSPFFDGCHERTTDAEVPVTSDGRSILGSDGCEWIVRELETPNADAPSKSLVFERPEVVRRVREYPLDWASLSDEQLYSLSLHV